MTTTEGLRSRRKEILEELGSLEHIRRGSVVEQYVDSVHKDGSCVRRGPYPLYSYKEEKKTVSRRLRNPEQVQRHRQQIQGFRRFQELVAELVSLGEQLCEAEGKASDVKKTPYSRWSKRRR